MEETKLPTLFLPAERLSDDDIRNAVESIKKLPIVKELLDTVPDPTLVLNKYRQIVFANIAFRKLINKMDEFCILGLRPGEAVGCVHSSESEGGCGTTEFCSVCGAANAILNSQRGAADSRECQIMLKNADALDLKIWATPFNLGDANYTFFSLVDVSSEKRRRALERIFFHDVMNTAGGLYGYADILLELIPKENEARNYADSIFQITGSVIEEIEAQKALAAAENNELILKPEKVDSLNIINEVADAYKNHESAKNKKIEVSPDSQSVALDTDKTQLKRVIGNMTKNALEASKAGDTVTLICYKDNDNVLFKVNNPVYMPRDIQLQVFKRSFSTKGAGRGLGTYSIKLLTERYLKGIASFTSSEEEGTTFIISLPAQG